MLQLELEGFNKVSNWGGVVCTSAMLSKSKMSQPQFQTKKSCLTIRQLFNINSSLAREQTPLLVCFISSCSCQGKEE